MTFGTIDNYLRLADVIGFCCYEQVNLVAGEIVKFQMDNGNREDRLNARYKCTVDRFGVDVVKKCILEKSHIKLSLPKEYLFTKSGDTFGWLKGTNKLWYYTYFVEGGRILDTKTIK